MFVHENPRTRQMNDFVVQGKHGEDFGVVGRLHLLLQPNSIHSRRDLVDDQPDPFDFESTSQFESDRGTLKILTIGAKHEDQHVEIMMESSVSSLTPG